MRILIVEDDALIALSIEDILTEAGHTVVGLAPSKIQALRLAKQTHPDLALIDLRLADGMTGVDLVHDFDGARLDLIIISALPPEIDGTIPDHAFIAKPFTSEMLLSAISVHAHPLGRNQAA